MNEDRLLRDLGHVAKEEEEAEQARLDERWDRLAAGTLTAEEELELRALSESSPEAREAWAAFRPLGPEFQARVVEKISRKRRGRVLPFPPAVRIGGWVTAAAAAAAVVVVLLRPSAPLPALPGYQIAVSAGASEMRGEQEETVQLAPGDQPEVILRPDTAVTEGKSLEARCFLVRGGEQRRMEVVQGRFEPSGAVKLKVSIARDLQPGPWTLWAVVGRPGDLPDPAELRSPSAKDEVRRRNWVAVSQDVRIQLRGP
jgi:hypothetical protein